MATMTIKNAAGTDEVVEKPLAPSRAAASASRPVVLSNEDALALAEIIAGNTAILERLLVAPATAANQALTNAALESLPLSYESAATARRSLLVSVAGSPLESDPEAHLGNLGGHVAPDAVAQISRAASVTQYSAGDSVGQGPFAFTVARNQVDDVNRSGRITGGTCTLLAASGTIVFPSFALLLFRPEANIPFQAGSYPADNAIMNITAAAFRQQVCRLQFSSTGWVNQLGAATAAGSVAWQAAGLTGYFPRPHASVNITGLGNTDLIGVVQDLGNWNPGNIAYTIDFRLDVDQD